MESKQSLPLDEYYYVDHLPTKVNVTVKKKYRGLTLTEMEDEFTELIERVLEEFEITNQIYGVVTEGDLILKISGQKKSAVHKKSAPNTYFKRSYYKNLSLALDEYKVDHSPTKIDMIIKKKYGCLTLEDMENDVVDLFVLMGDEFLKKFYLGNVIVTEGDLILKVAGPKKSSVQMISADNAYFKKQLLAFDEYNVDHSTTKINVIAKKKYGGLTLTNMGGEITDLIENVLNEFELSNQINVVVTEGDLSLKLSGQKKLDVLMKSPLDVYFKKRSLPAYNPGYIKQTLALDEYKVEHSPTQINGTAKKKYGGRTLLDMEHDVMDLFLRLYDELYKISRMDVIVTEGDLILKVAGPKKSVGNAYFEKQPLPLDEYSNVDHSPTMINATGEKKHERPTLPDKVDDIHKQSADKASKREKNGHFILLFSFIIVCFLSKYLLFE